MVDLLKRMFCFFGITVKNGLKKIGLTEEQLDDTNTYPNLRKLTLNLKKGDRSRAKYRKWIDEHGMVYSELDSFTPTQLRNLVRENVLKFVNVKSANSESELEKSEKELAYKYLQCEVNKFSL